MRRGLAFITSICTLCGQGGELKSGYATNRSEELSDFWDGLNMEMSNGCKCWYPHPQQRSVERRKKCKLAFCPHVERHPLQSGVLKNNNWTLSNSPTFILFRVLQRIIPTFHFQTTTTERIITDLITGQCGWQHSLTLSSWLATLHKAPLNVVCEGRSWNRIITSSTVTKALRNSVKVHINNIIPNLDGYLSILGIWHCTAIDSSCELRAAMKIEGMTTTETDWNVTLLEFLNNPWPRRRTLTSGSDSYSIQEVVVWYKGLTLNSEWATEVDKGQWQAVDFRALEGAFVRV